MKKIFLYCIILIITITFSKPIGAQNRGFGIGLIIGEPTGISAKLWTSSINAFDFGFGMSVGGDRISYNGEYNNSNRLHFHIDYLWHSFDALASSGKLPLYYGIGGRLNSGGGYDRSFGVRGVFGIAWLPGSVPIDLFFEIVPVLQLTSTFGLGIDAGFGVRYFFN